MNPGLTIATQVATNVGMTLGVDVFNGGVRPDPTRAVFCLCNGGQAPDDIIGDLVKSYQRPRVQIRVREESENFGAGETLARSVRNAVHLKVPAGYIDCRAVESSPLYLGPDDAGRHEWSINVELTIKE